MILVKEGFPSYDELEKLSMSIGNSWESLARRLRFSRMEILLDSIRITRNTKKGLENVGFDKNNGEYQKCLRCDIHSLRASSLFGSHARFTLGASGERRREDWGGTQERPRNPRVRPKWRACSQATTYKLLYSALCREFVKRRDIAEEFCCY